MKWLISKLAKQPFDTLSEHQKLMWGFMLSWSLCFNVVPILYLLAHFAGWIK